MMIFSNLLLALASICAIILNVLYWLILIRALISWVNPDPYNPIVQFLTRTTEPLLAPVRRILPAGPVDFSPIVVFLIIIFLQMFLVASLRDLGYHMRRQKSENSTQVFPGGSSAPLRGDQMVQ